jgi:hypothetical protein
VQALPRALGDQTRILREMPSPAVAIIQLQMNEAACSPVRSGLYIPAQPNPAQQEEREKLMDRKLKAAVAFGVSIAAMALLEKEANREASKLGLPHIVVGLLVAGVAHEI